ncbi:MORN repeat-containing protein, putative [Eimeria praecox]|uniref:MORN repeat-containing protein, putative n=1 Tax=Eimeria praecox TaxID=51316 RepID=U6GXS3_9EIME|nr:MORN repeat-containing protein, putative [Eimeria praecox]
MHPTESVFAIGGEDESEPEEDLLAEGARRLGALAAGVSPTVGTSTSKEETTSSEAAKTIPSAAATPTSPALVPESATPPAAGSLPSTQGSKYFLESHRCGVGSIGQGAPNPGITGAGEEQQCAAERASNSNSKTSVRHHTSALDDNTSVYRPEVDGPPIVGIYVVVQSALRRPEVLFHHQRSTCECIPLHPLDLSRCAERSLWRGQSEAGGSGAFSWGGEPGETTLLQWVEKFALPEMAPTRGHLQMTPAGSGSRDWENELPTDQRHSSHIFFTVPVAKSNGYVFGVSCYSVQNERLWDSSAPDDAQGMCAVCLVARVPFWGLLLFRLLPVTAAFFELMEGAMSGSPGRLSSSGLPTQVLVQLYDQLNTVNFHLMRYTEITFNLEAGLPPFIMAVTPRQLLVLVKALLLEKKILFYSCDASRASTAVLSFISLLPVDVDAITVEVKNTSLEPLLRLTAWEQQFARRIVMETSFSSGATEGESPGYGCSASISRHATDLLQQTISSLASHAAAHGLHFLRSKEDDPLVADSQRHRRRAASAMSPRDNRRRSNSSSSLRGGRQTVRMGGAKHQATEERKRDDDSSTLLGQSSTSSRELRVTMREGGTALTGNPCGVATDPKRQLKQQQQHHSTPEDVLASSYPSTSGGGGWLSERIRRAWERQAERHMHTTAAASIGKKSRNPSAAEGFHEEAAPPSFAGGAGVVFVEWPSGQRALPGTARFQTDSRSSSDATRPSSVLDPNWEAHADLIRAAFAQHLEQLCRKAAIAAGRERSRYLLLQQLSPTASDDGEDLSAFGVEWVRGWSETHNFQAWLLEHRLPNEGAPSAKHETLQPPPASGYAKYLYSNGDCYEGQFWASQRHGDGVYCSADGMRYDGSWVSDERHGHGVLAHESVGYLYVGQWQHNKKSGEGHLYSRKERYWGQFFDNKYHGRGRYVQREGLEYEGEFAKGRFEGLGKLSISRDEGKQNFGECRKGVVIRGSFEGGKVTGVVNAVYADGRTYTGELSPETLLPEGTGSMLYRDSCLYEGRWRNGMRHGGGVLTIPVGVLRGTSVSKGGQEEGMVTVDGQWIDDMPDHHAEWGVTFPTGDKYLGCLKFPSTDSSTGADAGRDMDVGQRESLAKIVPHGWGLSKRKDTGEIYEGQWISGMRHGNGECITRSGTRHSGEWRFGHPHGEGRHFDPSGCTQYGKFVGKNSPSSVKNEEACEEPPAGVPVLVFDAFETFPLANCPLLQPRSSARTTPCTVSPPKSPRNYGC